MKKHTYLKLMKYLEGKRRLTKSLIATERGIEVTVIVSFILLIFYTLYTSAGMALLSAATCLSALYICTVLRMALDRPRPYEVYNCMPAMFKDTKGKSFPSRHLTSIAVISVCLFKIAPLLGVPFFFLTLVMGFLRVFLGVHFIKDVAVGAVIGFAVGAAGMYIFPTFF